MIGFNEKIEEDNFKSTMSGLMKMVFFAGGCLSHKTAVAAGALSQYLRYMIDPGSEIYRNEVVIDGVNLLMEPVSQVGHKNQGQRVHQEAIAKANNLLEMENDNNADADNENDYKEDDLGENQEEEDDYANEKDGDDEELDAGPRDGQRDRVRGIRDDYLDEGGDEDEEDEGERTTRE